MERTNQPAPLKGLRVLDMSSGVAGQFAARLLADWGADVILVEPPDGAATRRVPLGGLGEESGDVSPLFFHLNTGKRVAAVDRAQQPGARVVHRLAERADVVIAERDDEEILSIATHSPRLVVAVVRDFASVGPYAHWVGSEMIHQALSGLMNTTGKRERQPLFGFGNRAYYSAGAATAVAVLAAVRLRDSTGRGQTVDISVHEVAASMSQNLVTQFAYSGANPIRGKYVGASGVSRVADGWIVLFCPAGRWPDLATEFGLDELRSDPRFATFDQLVANWDAGLAALRPVLEAMPAVRAVEAVQRARCMAAKVLTPIDVLSSTHLSARDYWCHVGAGSGRRLALGPMFRLTSGWRPTPEPARSASNMDVGWAEVGTEPAERA